MESAAQPLVTTLRPASIARETLAQVRASGFERLLRDHASEVSHFKDLPLDVDWGRYEYWEQRGGLRPYIARAAGEVIGYAVFILDVNAHYKSSLQAIQDVLYLDPAWRGG